MPIICSFRGIRITINYNDHMPPHFHAYYGEYECCVDSMVHWENRIDICKDALYMDSVPIEQ